MGKRGHPFCVIHEKKTMMTIMTVALKARDDDGRKKEGGEMIRKSTEGPRDYLYTRRWMMTTMMDDDEDGLPENFRK
jgi:hypothetical protein